MAITDAIQTLKDTIIALLNTRSNIDLSNISSKGQDVIRGYASANPVGTVIAYMGKDTPAGYLLMDGREVSKTTYAALYAVVGDTMGKATNSGNFVIANVTDGRYLQGSTVAGGRVNAGLPNITGSITNMAYLTERRTTPSCWTGGFYYSASGGSASSTGDARYLNIATMFNASKSNNTYSKSSTVTPLSLKVRYFIKY